VRKGEPQCHKRADHAPAENRPEAPPGDAQRRCHLGVSPSDHLRSSAGDRNTREREPNVEDEAGNDRRDIADYLLVGVERPGSYRDGAEGEPETERESDRCEPNESAVPPDDRETLPRVCPAQRQASHRVSLGCLETLP
jgi:hypothetical protein